MIDVLCEEDPPKEIAHWYQRLQRLTPGEAVRYSRLTAWIDRADQTRTAAYLFAPTEDPLREPPDAAWTAVCPPAGTS
jgi:hypothetical protein